MLTVLRIKIHECRRTQSAQPITVPLQLSSAPHPNEFDNYSQVLSDDDVDAAMAYGDIDVMTSQHTRHHSGHQQVLVNEPFALKTSNQLGSILAGQNHSKEYMHQENCHKNMYRAVEYSKGTIYGI